jgi:hypothetical protein
MAGDTSGVLQLATNGSTTAVTVDASQNVGIGTASPTTYGDSNTKLAVYKATSGATFINTLVGTDNVKYATYINDWSAGSDQIVKTGTSTNHAYAFLTNGTERMRINASGLILFGTTDTDVTNGAVVIQNLNAVNSFIKVGHKTGSITGSDFIAFYYNNTQIGGCSQSGTTAVAYNTSSDYRLKENIVPMTGALDKVALLKPVTYTWKLDGSDGQGFIAHELQEVIPDAVTGEKDAVDEDGNIKPQGIDTSFLVATLTAAIQEQQTIINDLKARITALEGAA